MNYTRPGRFHIIVKGRLIYLTVWLFGWRFHYCNGAFPPFGSHHIG